MSAADSDWPIPIPPQAPSGTAGVRVVRASDEGRVEDDDRVAVEAPLEIQLHHPALGETPVSFGTTMRTPGEDEWLAAGLLYGEGVVNRASDIEAIESSTRKPNVVNVRLNPRVDFDVQISTRRFSAGSSCGVCGTTSLDATIARAATVRLSGIGTIEWAVLTQLPRRMRESQSKFGDTGAIHASAAFDLQGSLLGIAEDVGRHNAFDKLVGGNLMAGRLPLTDRLALLGGRASFELVQKALRSGVTVLAAIGAPSSIAVNLARTSGLTLIGFLRESRCNVYSNPERLTGA
jgi:FdhD protein